VTTICILLAIATLSLASVVASQWPEARG